jgi:hypothetical protein
MTTVVYLQFDTMAFVTRSRLYEKEGECVLGVLILEKNYLNINT